MVAGDIGDEAQQRVQVERTVHELGRGWTCLVNNAAEQQPDDEIGKVTATRLERTFRTKHLRHVLSHPGHAAAFEGSAIINTTSVTACRASPAIMYSASKGTIVAFTRSPLQALVDSQIRVNAVTPGPIWTPLIPSTHWAEETATFGADVPMKRPGQPEEVASSYVFLASDDGSSLIGQALHPNGGIVVNG